MAFMITVLIGAGAFAVDAGQMYRYRAQIHVAADAAALAGVLQMTSIDATKTVDTAQSYAWRHVVGDTTVTLAVADVIPGTWTPGGGFVAEPSNDFTNVNNDAVKVTTRDTAKYLFARVFGFDKRALTATAVAVRGSVGSATCVRPWAVPYFLLLKALYPTLTLDPTTFVLGDSDVTRLHQMTSANNIALKVGDTKDGVINGNFYGVELPPVVYANGTIGNPWSGGSNYGSAIGESCASLATRMAKQTTNPSVSVGDWLAPENGNMQGPTLDGLQTLCSITDKKVYVCNNPVRITVALWDQAGNAPGVSCGGKCFHVKYMGVFYVTQWDDVNKAVVGYFQTMDSDGGFVAAPGPIIKRALVQ
jgi:Flp pilus assembly protein TadG